MTEYLFTLVVQVAFPASLDKSSSQATSSYFKHLGRFQHARCECSARRDDTSSIKVRNERMCFEDSETALCEKYKKDRPVYEKPGISYPKLIKQTISTSPDKQMTLAAIYTSIEEAYPYFRYTAARSWKNAIRHNLSIQKAFERIPKDAQDEKGSLWRLTGETGTRRKKPVTKTVDEENGANTNGIATESVCRYRPIRSASLAVSNSIQMKRKPARGNKAKKKAPQRRWSFPSCLVPLLPKLSMPEHGEPLRFVSPRMQSQEAFGLLEDDQDGFGIELVENLSELEIDRLLAMQVQPNVGSFEEIQLPFPEMNMSTEAEMNVRGDNDPFSYYSGINEPAMDWHADERRKARSPPAFPHSYVEEAQEISRIFFGI